MAGETTVKTATVLAGVAADALANPIVDAREIFKRYITIDITNNGGSTDEYAALAILGPLVPPLSEPATQQITPTVVQD